MDQDRRLKALGKENGRLKKLVADLSLDNQIQKEVSSGNFKSRRRGGEQMRHSSRWQLGARSAFPGRQRSNDSVFFFPQPPVEPLEVMLKRGTERLRLRNPVPESFINNHFYYHPHIR